MLAGNILMQMALMAEMALMGMMLLLLILDRRTVAADDEVRLLGDKTLPIGVEPDHLMRKVGVMVLGFAITL